MRNAFSAGARTVRLAGCGGPFSKVTVQWTVPDDRFAYTRFGGRRYELRADHRDQVQRLFRVCDTGARLPLIAFGSVQSAALQGATQSLVAPVVERAVDYERRVAQVREALEVTYSPGARMQGLDLVSRIAEDAADDAHRVGQVREWARRMWERHESARESEAEARRARAAVQR